MSDDSLLPSDGNAALARDLCDQAGQRHAAGDYPAARALYERALSMHDRVPGAAHPEIARCLQGLGVTLREQGDYAGARGTLERALSIRKEVLGAEHSDTAESMQALGEVQFDLGDLDSGQNLIRQALAIREQVLGPEHPDTIDSVRSLALMLAHRGNRTQAQQMLEHALSVCERALGQEHLTTARVLNGLGIVWAADRRTYGQARAAYERALAIYESVLPSQARVQGTPVHPFAALTVNNLAAVLADMHEDTAALPLLERSLVLHERIFGAGHPRLAFVLVNLADVYTRQGRYDAACPLLERALIVAEPALGAQHPQTIKSLRKLVAVLGHLHAQGDEQAMTAAMPLYQCLAALEAATGTPDSAFRGMPGAWLSADRAAEQMHKLVGELKAGRDRPSLSEAEQADLQQARNLVQQADALSGHGDHAAARDQLEQALAIQERVLGEYHLDHVPLLNKLAKVQEALGRPSAALPLVQRVADIHIHVLGSEHPMTSAALMALASRYSYEYGLAEALPLLEQVLWSTENSLGPDDPRVAAMRSSLERLQASLPPEKGGGERPVRSRSEKREEALATWTPAQEALLAGLEDVPWHELRHAYGPADDVPELLHMLLSDDESVRDDAWEDLYSNVWHQGTVYQATPYVVPFLLRMLADDGPPERVALLHFLSALAQGSSYLAAHEHLDQDDSLSWRNILARQGRDFDSELQRELDQVEAVNRAVGEGLPLYLDMVEDEDPEIRRLALDILAHLHGRAGDIVPRLQALLSAVQDPARRAKTVRALHELMDDGRSAQRFFAGLLGSGESERVSFVASAALATRARQETPEAAVEVLLRALQHIGAVQRDEPGAPGQEVIWEWDDLPFAMQALAHLGSGRAVEALLRALPTIQEADSAREVAAVLLDLVFNDGQTQAKSTAIEGIGQGADRRKKTDYWQPKPQPQREASTLTDAQRAVLAAIAAHDPVWRDEHNLLRLYGLPAVRQELQQFVSQG